MQKTYFGIPLSQVIHILALNVTLFYLIPETYRDGIWGLFIII